MSHKGSRYHHRDRGSYMPAGHQPTKPANVRPPRITTVVAPPISDELPPNDGTGVQPADDE